MLLSRAEDRMKVDRGVVTGRDSPRGPPEPAWEHGFQCSNDKTAFLTDNWPPFVDRARCMVYWCTLQCTMQHALIVRTLWCLAMQSRLLQMAVRWAIYDNLTLEHNIQAVVIKVRKLASFSIFWNLEILFCNISDSKE